MVSANHASSNSALESCDGKGHVVVQLIFVHHGGFVQCHKLSEIYKPVTSIPYTSFAQKGYSLVVTLVYIKTELNKRFKYNVIFTRKFHFLVLATRNSQLATATRNSQLATRNCNSQLATATRNSQLATRNSQLATRNSQLQLATATRNSTTRNSTTRKLPSPFYKWRQFKEISYLCLKCGKHVFAQVISWTCPQNKNRFQFFFAPGKCMREKRILWRTKIRESIAAMYIQQN